VQPDKFAFVKHGKDILKVAADNIRYYRQKSNLSQEKLAEYADVHRNYIGRIERCEINISLVQLAKIAIGLKVHPSELLKD
jgi:transcriptional regulator with XRE-family HTH domain